VQVGDGIHRHLRSSFPFANFVHSVKSDKAYWGGDLSIPKKRPSYQINDRRYCCAVRLLYLPVIHASRPGTDVAAGASAAFAACSNLYANRSLGPSYSAPASLYNSSYAQTLLTHAEDLYSFAVNASGGQRVYQKSVSEVKTTYPSSSYGDELAMAALLLAWATNSSGYYSQAVGYYSQYSLGRTDSVFNWDSKTPGLAVLFAQLANANTTFAGNLSSWQADAEWYFDRILNWDGPSRNTEGARFHFRSYFPRRLKTNFRWTVMVS